MPGPDHHFSPREPSTRWPSRASSSTSRTAQFSTRSLVMTRQLAENRPHLGPSASRCAPKVYFSVPLVPYLRRERTSEREDPTAQNRKHGGILPQEGSELLFANRRNHRHQFFHQVYGAGEVGAPRRSRGLLEIGFFVSAAGRGIWGSGAHPGAAGRSQPHANPACGPAECALSSTGLSAVVRALCVRIPDGLPICAEPLPFSSDGRRFDPCTAHSHETPVSAGFLLCSAAPTLTPRPCRSLMSLSLIHISEPTRLRRISYAVFCLKKK